MKPPKRPTQPPHLSWSEYVSPGASENAEIAGARWEFVRAVQRVLPRFFAELRQQVYPTYASLVKAGYWKPGWTFEAWCNASHSFPSTVSRYFPAEFSDWRPNE